MRKYKLLKDLPGFKAGCEIEITCCPNISNMREWRECGDLLIDRPTIENNPEWFEEIQEKEFTGEDMMKFAYHVMDNHSHSQNCAFVEILNEWLKERK